MRVTQEKTPPVRAGLMVGGCFLWGPRQDHVGKPSRHNASMNPHGRISAGQMPAHADGPSVSSRKFISLFIRASLRSLPIARNSYSGETRRSAGIANPRASQSRWRGYLQTCLLAARFPSARFYGTIVYGKD
jgi:hypothetical protein